MRGMMRADEIEPKVREIVARLSRTTAPPLRTTQVELARDYGITVHLSLIHRVYQRLGLVADGKQYVTQMEQDEAEKETEQI